MRLGKFCLLTCVGIALAPSWFAHADTPSAASAPAKYELPAIPDEFKDADAIILSWDQKWTVAPDGSITQHETKRVLIKNDRAIGAFADPRITYNKDWQTVKVLVARTITPDGQTTDVPPYSRNVVAPSESAGWPAFAAIEQIVLTYSAIEPGAILELEWERVTKPGMKSSLEIDERVEVDYPCLSRDFSVNDRTTTTSHVAKIPAIREEPQCLTADEVCRWFSYPNRDNAWIGRLIERYETNAKSTERLTSAARDWAKGKSGDVETVDAIQKRLREAVTVVSASSAFLPDAMRNPDAVLQSRYGTPIECASLFLAMCREAGVSARPFVMTVRRMQGGSEVLPLGHLAPEYAGISISTGDSEAFWNLERGRIFVDSMCDRRDLYCLKDGKAVALEQPRWEYNKPIIISNLNMSGTLQIASDGKWTGRFTIDATRVFRRGKNLETEGDRKQFAAGLLERIVPDISIKSVSVRSLSDDRIEIAAEVNSNAAVPTVDGHRMLHLAADGPWTRDVSMTLRTSKRERPMRIADAFNQTIKLTLETPKEWVLSSSPRTIGSNEKENAGAYQRVDSAEGRIVLEQRVSVPNCVVFAKDYPRLRTALSELQTDSARTFIWKTPADAAQKVN